MSRPVSHGVYGDESRRLYFSQRALQNASCSGVIPLGSSPFFIEFLARGAGFKGNGCVGDDFSPGTSLCGTGRSSIPKIGLPFERSKMKSRPILLICATA